MTEELKLKKLKSFCGNLFHKDTKCGELIRVYREYEQLDRIYGEKAKKRRIKFKAWSELQTELLAVYSPKDYLKCEEIFLEHKSVAYWLNNKEDIEGAFNLVNKEIYPLVSAVEEKLNRILKKTTKYFSDI